MTEAPSKEALLQENQQLHAKLEELEETLRAIRSGEVDALVVSRPEGEQIFTLKGALEPYRIMVENMSEGAVTFASDGTIIYCNARFAEMTKTSLEDVISSSLQRFILPADGEKFAALLSRSQGRGGQAGLSLMAADGTVVPVTIAVHRLAPPAPNTTVAVVTDVTEIVAAEEKLRELSIRDSLTGLFNRRYMDETLERELARAEREAKPVSVVMMDLDFFKGINDEFGHRAGDLMLQCLGELLQGQTRTGDVACRYGGEEFVVVMLNTPPDAACKRAEEWRALVDGLHVPYGKDELHVTVSIGVAAFPLNGRNADAVLTAADQALYAAKAAGRNRVAAATPAE